VRASTQVVVSLPPPKQCRFMMERKKERKNKSKQDRKQERNKERKKKKERKKEDEAMAVRCTRDVGPEIQYGMVTAVNWET